MNQETIKQVLKFRDDRDWKQFHNPKDLAISISLEAAELLEIFQWSGSDTVCESKTDKIREELADVLEVLLAICEARGHSVEELMNVRNEKREAHGGFKQKIYWSGNE